MPKKWKSEKMIPLDVIKAGLKDPDCDVRTAAMNACSGREIPPGRDQGWVERPRSDEECSTGYHFFCTRKEAEAY